MTIDEKTEEVRNEPPNFLIEKTELGQVMDNLDAEDGKLDMNSRLSETQIAGILVAEELRDSGILYFIGITGKAKKLNVSRNGLGRDEKVRIVAGDREMKSGQSFGNKFAEFFRPQK